MKSSLAVSLLQQKAAERLKKIRLAHSSGECADPKWWHGRSSPSDVEAFLAAYDELDALLVSKGFPPTSPWWRERIERFTRSGRRSSIWRVGRRGGKSSTFCRVLVVLALFAKWPIPPGDVGVVAIISVDNGEASGRTATIKSILEVIGVPFGVYASSTASGWKILDRPIQFRVKTCSIAGTSGFTAIAVLADEMAKWRSPSDGANPSKEILTSLRATTATMRDAKVFVSSSAFSTTDHHAKMVAAGDSEVDDQVVFIGATWETNPTLTEADTRKLEPDIAKHDREYGSIPTDGGENPWFSVDGIDHVGLSAVNHSELSGVRGGQSFACIDTGFKRNASGLVILQWLEDGRLVTREIVKVVPQPNQPLKPSVVLGKFAERLRAHGVQIVAADQHYIETAREELSEFSVVELPGGNTGKNDVYTRARDSLREGVAKIDSNETDLIRQLRQVYYKLSNGGSITICSPEIDGQHGDLASAYVGAVWIAIEIGPSGGDLSLGVSSPRERTY